MSRFLNGTSRLFGRRLCAGVGIAATLAGAPHAAFGQAAVASSNSGLDEIVITANKLNTLKVLDTPASI